MKEESKMWGID